MNNNSIYEIVDERFRKLILTNVKLQRVSTGHLWTEGPVWFADHNVLLFSDIPNQQILRWSACGAVTIFRDYSSYANGHTRDRQGRLISCQHGTRSITRTEHDGSINQLVTEYKGHCLNSPNDVVVKSDDSIWFTDPTYGIMSDYEGNKADSEQEGKFVFRFDVNTNDLQVVAKDFNQPNGLAFSLNEDKIYIVESGQSEDLNVPAVVKVYDVDEDNKLTNGRSFAYMDPGIPDGLRVDYQDNVWISAADGIHCFAPCGTLLGKIYVPETVSNLTFGGIRGNQLFITATTSVYSIYLNSSSAVK